MCYFNVSMIKNGEPFSISNYGGQYSWWYKGKQNVLSEYSHPNCDISFAVGATCLYILKMSGDVTSTPYELKVYSLDGDYLWDVGDIARSISPRHDFFTSVQVHTKSSLSQLPWSMWFGGCSLCKDHEYIVALSFDGEYWLLDSTDKEFIHKVFTK